MENKTKRRRARRSFTDEFKAGAVRLVLDEGKTVAQVSRDLGLTASALGRWVERARADRTNGKTGLTTAEREELSRLRKECRVLRMERDIILGMEKTHWAWGTSARIGLWSISEKMAARLAPQDGQRQRPLQENAMRNSFGHLVHLTRAKPDSTRPQSRYLATAVSQKPRQKP